MCSKADSIYDAILSIPQNLSTAPTRTTFRTQRKINLDPYGGDGVYVDSKEGLIEEFDFLAFLNRDPTVYTQSHFDMRGSLENAGEKFDISRTIERLAMVGGHIEQSGARLHDRDQEARWTSSPQSSRDVGAKASTNNRKEGASTASKQAKSEDDVVISEEHLPCWP